MKNKLPKIQISNFFSVFEYTALPQLYIHTYLLYDKIGT